jgi:lipid-binding SYLF domain-containing protein
MRKKLTAFFGLSMICLLMSGISGEAFAATRREIDASIDDTLERFYGESSDGKKLVREAKGVLVFPKVYKAGLGIGGEYGEGALLIKGRAVDYYSTAAASFGFQIGAQKKSIILLFMQEDALKNFRSSSNWKAGVDASVALIAVGVGGSIDTSKLNAPILGFVLGQKGLMYNLTLEGTKITKIHKDF